MFAKDFSAFVPFNPVSFDRIAEFGQSLSAQLEKMTRLQFDAGLASTRDALAAVQALLEVKEPASFLQWQETHVKPGIARAADCARCCLDESHEAPAARAACLTLAPLIEPRESATLRLRQV